MSLYEKILARGGANHDVYRCDLFLYQVQTRGNQETVGGVHQGYLMFPLGTGVRAGDVLRNKLTGGSILIDEMRRRGFGGRTIGWNAFYSPCDGAPALPTAECPVWVSAGMTIECPTRIEVPGDPLASSSPFDLSYIEEEIRRRDEDVDALLELVGIVGSFTEVGGIRRGALKGHGALLEKHSWLGNAIKNALVCYLT